MKTLSVATTTQSDIVPSSNYVWYKAYEGTGTTLADTAGNGATTTVLGTLTNIWNNVGYITVNATDNYALVGSDAYIDSILDIATMNVGDRIIVSFDYYHDGTINAARTLLYFGENGTSGGLAVEINTSAQIFITHRGVGAASAASNIFHSILSRHRQGKDREVRYPNRYYT